MPNLDGIGAILATLAALVFVLLAAWFLLKWVGKISQGQRVSRYITVLDRVMIGQDKCILLVCVAEQKMLIGMSNGAVVKLCDIEDAANALKPQETQDFSSMLQTALDTVRKGKKND